jgi:Na+/proline symporter
MLLTGGSAVINNLTGAPVAAAVFLFPIGKLRKKNQPGIREESVSQTLTNTFSGVVVYTLFGGIKATFITDYINALVIIVIIFVFAFTVYATNSILGSPGRVWEILTEIAAERPLEGNAGGSYLTMRSDGGSMYSSFFCSD